MEQYSYSGADGKITRGAAPSGMTICLMDLGEWEKSAEGSDRQGGFPRGMERIQYCKMENYGECVRGTMRVPKGAGDCVSCYNFGFCLTGNELYFVRETDFLRDILRQMGENVYREYSPRQILLALFEQLLQDDVMYLQKQEERLAGLEEELLRELPDCFYERLIKYRKRFNLFHAYYEQLMNMADVVQLGAGQMGKTEEKFSDAEQAQWQLFAARVQRLHDHVEMLREYLVQIRDLYQSLIAVRQNQATGMLAVVTALFLPLSLIAAWYGMNFPNMPEFHWKYSYPAVIIVGVAVVAAEIFYFKRKKLF